MNHEHHHHNHNREDNNNSRCYFHPKQVFVGVCPFCLNERLLILAASKKADHLPSSARNSGNSNYKTQRFTHTKLSAVTFPKIFAFGSFFNRLELRNWKSDDPDHDHDYVSTSQEDSFISIKFGDNGVASWEKGKGTVSKVTLEHCNSMTWNHNHSLSNKESNKSVVEHAKPRASLRWRKRIGHLFQLIRWKRSNNNKSSSVCHVGSKAEGVKVRKSWIRTLTKRRTKE